MATTAVEPLRSTDPLAVTVYELYCAVQGDLDKAGDADDVIYYTGLVDAYHTVLMEMGALGSRGEDTGTCAYCETAIRLVDGVWIDFSDGDVCVGDLDNVNENQPHVLAIPDIETEV